MFSPRETGNGAATVDAIVDFTRAELRAAIDALAVIDREGREDEFAAVLREATAPTPASALWGNATPRQVVTGGLLARRLSALLDVPLEVCETAAADAIAPQRRRAVYQAIIGYAAELAEQPAAVSVEAPDPKQEVTTEPSPRAVVRIVADDSQRRART